MNHGIRKDLPRRLAPTSHQIEPPGAGIEDPPHPQVALAVRPHGDEGMKESSGRTQPLDLVGGKGVGNAEPDGMHTVRRPVGRGKSPRRSNHDPGSHRSPFFLEQTRGVESVAHPAQGTGQGGIIPADQHRPNPCHQVGQRQPG